MSEKIPAHNINILFYTAMLLMLVELIQHSILHKVVDDTDGAKVAKSRQKTTYLMMCIKQVLV